MIKSIVIAAALVAAFFSPPVQAAKPFRTVIPVKVICMAGGPEGMLEILLEKYNERMVAGMDLTMSGGKIHMYIAQNKNNPSASVFLHSERANAGAGQTCLFWGAKDWLHIIETESLPAKRPSEDTDAQPMSM